MKAKKWPAPSPIDPALRMHVSKLVGARLLKNHAVIVRELIIAYDNCEFGPNQQAMVVSILKRLVKKD